MAWRPLTVTSDTLTPGLKRFFDKAGVGAAKKDKTTADFRARQAVALQLLNFVLNGSSNERVVPPIRWGVLRGSGSAFVDGVLVGDTKSNYPDGTPNTAYAAEAGDVTIGFNTAYAARMHETTWVPGGATPSKQAEKNPGMLADVGNKFVEKHLVADKDALLRMYTDVFKREAGT